MFYDERIEKEKGRICQGAMLLAVAFTLPYWALHTLYVWRNAPMAAKLPLVALDGVITLTGLVLLTLGLLRHRGTDERELLERCRFYSRTAPWYLGLVGVCYAILLPMQRHLYLPSQFASSGVDDILEPLAFVIGIYLFYSFKKREIYFNYSIMESDRYAHSVWKNIGKFALGICAALGISLAALALLPVFNPAGPMPMFFKLDMESMGTTALVMLGKYAGMLVGGSALYLFLSFLEKESYQKLSGLSRAAGWSLVVTGGLYGLGLIFSAFSLRISRENLPLAVKLLPYLPDLSLYRNFALMMFLIYFSAEYQRSQPDRAIDRGCKCILLTAGGFTVLTQYQSLLMGILLQFPHSLPSLLEGFGYYLMGRVLMQDLLYLAGGIGILTALIRHRMLSRWNLPAIPAALAALALRTVLWVQTGGTGVTGDFSGASTIVLLCYLCILVFRVIGKTGREENRIP